MFCPHCGGPVEDGAAFCTYCGQPVGNAQAQAPQAAPLRPQQPAPQTSPAPQPAPAPAKAAKSGTGLGVKLTALALAGTAAFFGGKALLNGLGGDPPAETRPAYTQSAQPGDQPGGTSADPGTPSTGGLPTDPVIRPTEPGVFYDADTGRFQGESGVGQQPVAAGTAMGMTTEEAAAQEIFFTFQQFSFATEKEDPDYDSELLILKLDPENGTACLLADPDDEDAVLPFQYDPDSGTIRLRMEEDEDYAELELVRNPDGSWSGSAQGRSEGEPTSAYLELNRVTPSRAGAWVSLETGEIVADEDCSNLQDTRLGQAFLGRAAEYAAANGCSMQPREPDEQSPSYQPGPAFQQPVELSPELIDYYVMVEGQNRLREKALEAGGQGTVSHVQLPKTNSITEAEFEARVEEYIRRWAPFTAQGN